MSFTFTITLLGVLNTIGYLMVFFIAFILATNFDPHSSNRWYTRYINLSWLGWLILIVGCILSGLS